MPKQGFTGGKMAISTNDWTIRNRREVDHRAQWIVDSCNARADHVTKLESFARELIEHLRQRAEGAVDPERRDVWRYFQFISSIPPLQAACRQAKFSEAFDFVSLGLSNKTEAGYGTVEHGRFASFCANRLIHNDALIEDILGWGASFWYLSREFATYAPVARDLVQEFEHFSKTHRPDSPNAVQAYGQVAEWLVEHERESADVLPFVKALEKYLGGEHQMNAAIYLQGRVGQLVDFPRHEVAQIARNHPRARIRLQVLVQDWMVDGGSLASILEASSDLRAEDGEYMAYELLFRVITPVVASLVRDSNYCGVIEVLAAWTRKRGDVDSPQIMFLWDESGARILQPDGSQSLGLADPIAVIEAFNTFRKTTITMRGSEMVPEFPGDRRGLVLGRGGSTYETLLTGLVTSAKIHGSECQPLTLVPVEPHPIQAVMGAAKAGMSPWSVSLRKPKHDSKIVKAAIFVSDPGMEQTETKEVARLLELSGVKVIYTPPDDCSQERLRCAWEDASYDLIWISGHGEFSGLDPAAAQIQMGTDAVTFAEIRGWTTPNRTHRRLVVLNTCFGGSSLMLEGPGGIGLATAVAGPDQAVVSHLWNSQVLASACFGILLSSQLNALSFFGSFESALGKLREGSDGVEGALRDSGSTFTADRVANQVSLQWDDLAIWGSPCFFQ